MTISFMLSVYEASKEKIHFSDENLDLWRKIFCKTDKELFINIISTKNYTNHDQHQLRPFDFNIYDERLARTISLLWR